MKTSVFLSYPQPFRKKQQDFILRVRQYLLDRGYEPRIRGVTDYDIQEPLAVVRRLMLESNGVLCVAFRMTKINEGTITPDNEIRNTSRNIIDRWLTSPWCHMEVAMAYQLGLPIMVLREMGVMIEGILEPGVMGSSILDFELDRLDEEYFRSEQWKQTIGKWEGYVQRVTEYKGNPPKMF